jgi:hypothetical protein
VNVTIVFARRWNFPDKKDSSRIVTGAEFTFVPEASERRPNEDEKGARPMAVKGDVTLFAQLRALPGRYDVSLEPRADNNGNTYLRCVDLRPLDVSSAAGPAVNTNGAAAPVGGR